MIASPLRRILTGFASLLPFVATPVMAQDAPTAAIAAPSPARWSIAIHGGAGTITREAMTPEKEAEYRGALDRGLAAGIAVLEKGGAALDAVQAVVVTLEDDPHFNAGAARCLPGMARMRSTPRSWMAGPGWPGQSPG